MRRIPRVRQPSAVLTQCLQTSTANTASHRAATRATTTTCLSRPRDFSTTSSRPFHSSRTWAKETPTTTEVPTEQVEPSATNETPKEEAGSSATNEVPKEDVEPSATTHAQGENVEAPEGTSAVEKGSPIESDPAEPAEEFEAPLAVEDDIATDLVLPPQEKHYAPRPDDLIKGGMANYQPAESTKDLEMVGGLRNWFNKDEHLPRSKLKVERFAPDTKVTDPALLELHTRRAVIEAVAVQSESYKGLEGRNLLTEAWSSKDTLEAVERVHALNLKVGRGGAGELIQGQPEVQAVIEHLSGVNGEDIYSSSAYISPEEAKEMCAKFSPDWKRVSLEDARFRFMVNKRIYQLTGQQVPDAKMIDVKTVGQLLALIIKPPAPRKVYESILQQDALTKLPNVEIHAKRITPIDKDKKVGRWKVIEEILKKRGLPVTGDGGVGKFVHDKWFRGPRVTKKGRRRA